MSAAASSTCSRSGGHLSRVCIGHCDSEPYPDYCLSIIERGAYMAFDNLGLQMGDLEERIAGLVIDLARRGNAERVLLSHDVGQTAELRCFGGRGYTYLVEKFLPRLRAAGASEDLIREDTHGPRTPGLSCP